MIMGFMQMFDIFLIVQMIFNEIQLDALHDNRGSREYAVVIGKAWMNCNRI